MIPNRLILLCHLGMMTPSSSNTLVWQLYPPAEWTDDPKRCAYASVSAPVGFMTKNRIAAAQIRAATATQGPRGMVLGDAASGDDSALRDELNAQELIYALGIRSLATVWWECVNRQLRHHQRRGLAARAASDATHPPIRAFVSW